VGWDGSLRPIPYAVIGDPQSFNLYSYVRNTPATQYDSDGHCPDGICTNIATLTPAQVDHKGWVAGQAAIGALKAVGSAAYHADMVPNKREPNTLKPQNEAQGVGKIVTSGAIAVGSVIAGSPASTKTASESTSVVHFTSDAGVVGITESGGALRAGTYVTTPSEVPAGATSSGIESLLEIGPGKGANSVTFETPNSNLAVPENGTTTSGGAQQFQLKEPVKIDPSNFKKTGKGGD
jgi:hypothetical protein